MAKGGKNSNSVSVFLTPFFESSWFLECVLCECFSEGCLKGESGE